MSAPLDLSSTAMVLVHGSWHGAWCWKRVLPLLRGVGVETHAVTLTGVGERAHLLSPSVGIDTHIQDVIGLIEAEELQRVVLVGHSYAGNLITCVADRLQRSRPGLLRHLVYLDAGIPTPGSSWSTPHSPETVARRVAEGQASGGLSFPPPDASVFGLTGADRDWVNRRQTPQPFRLYQEPLTFDPALVWAIPHSFIDCTNPPLPTIDAARQRVRSEPGWTVHELATGHDPMVSAPRELAQLLLAIHHRSSRG
ncbi:MAG: esterase [Burkholderiales bacterium RIFCSPHIGHO2_02_FULL_66_10]|jgi:pimeloyl-ACP methyl ester carboxylesterase|uniref:alpha/beta fold hydrolase n=1 Tax=Hydrogenophaga sp. TaxID=1904254 RepID=UPI0008C50792|nr:alpha/beta hydrolase [Hydrogenophaga sp.]MBU4181108.1 alpha/beta hydrolase [Gammaproteobacteria bacterium]MBW8471543.1 alpha/beta hydrolase [Thiobacillus sp.]OGB26563.1 MAG: esterase [Burkholderiales bacterium RIFCSPHIGHO2_02_FULL_66_10]OGB33016.1 MAG: esterase [Burkholderiales bacterium RIFCSPLOWO2_02_FULL_66_35]PKO77950.1 MAG: alpha/beta hydrolase [Betaproteobacteria bacterium HGW-Betaproteobacteria-15]